MANKICAGCGIELQTESINTIGYTTSIDNELCQRCFRLKNYGEYQSVVKTNEDFISILKKVNSTRDTVLLVVDILNIDRDLKSIREYISNKIILVLNKRDVLPKSINDERIIAYFKEQNLGFEDIVIISTMTNYNLDLLLNKIHYYQRTKRVYIVGYTNAGKSSLINQLIHNYSKSTAELTISPLPSTTLNKVEIRLNDDLILVDTPGLVNRNNIINYLDNSIIKRINSKKEIKPRTYQIKPNQALLVENFLRIDYPNKSRNSFTFYISNALKIKKVSIHHQSLKNTFARSIKLLNNCDLVINGLGFIHVITESEITVYVNQNVEIFVRKELIGGNKE